MVQNGSPLQLVLDSKIIRNCLFNFGEEYAVRQRWAHKTSHTEHIKMNRPVTNNMPSLKRKSPRKSSGKRPAYYGGEPDSPALKPPSKFKQKIGYKESRKKSPVRACEEEIDQIVIRVIV